jgi:hypothetical protein
VALAERSARGHAADAFTGERLAFRVGRAPAASARGGASVPGLFASQRLLDRRAMDGGVSGSGIHADLAPPQRALVLPIAGTLVEPFTIAPDATDREVAVMAGTESRFATADCPRPSTS